MTGIQVEHEATVWMVNKVPARMVYAGRRWRVTDHPTRLREPIWRALEAVGGLYGWRFQASSDQNETYVFDVFRASDGWHVHRAYA